MSLVGKDDLDKLVFNRRALANQTPL